MADVKGHVIPVYVVVDESSSMRSQLAELNEGMASLYEALRGEPMAAAKVRLTVLGFSDGVRVRLPLCDVREDVAMPQVSIGGKTSYRAVFQDLLIRIPDDIATLKNQRYLVHRPAVFVLSDGMPNADEDWRRPHAALVDKSATSGAPNIIAFGVGQADASAILAVATTPEFAFVAVRGTEVGEAIRRCFMTLVNSVVYTGQALSSPNPTLVVDKPEQFVLAIDLV